MPITTSSVWAWQPQVVLTEHVVTWGRAAAVGPQAVVTGGVEAEARRQFDLRFAIVTSAECMQMAEFYRQQRGPLRPFLFANPNDGQTYLVRFAEDLRVELWTPVFFQTAGVPLVEVQSR